MPLESRLCWSNRAPFRPISGRAARSWESRPRKRPRPTSAQFAHALDHRKASQSRPDRGREAHRQDRARSHPQASLPGGPRRETPTGVEAHPTLEVARETSREFPEDRRKILTTEDAEDTEICQKTPPYPLRPLWSKALWLCVQVHHLHRQVPVRVEDLEAPLLFALERILVGIHLLLQRGFVKGFVGHGGVLEYDGHAEVPAAVFGGVIARLVHPYLGDAPHLRFFFQHGIVVLLEELQKFLGVATLCFVVVLHAKGFVRGCWSRLSDGNNRRGEDDEQQGGEQAAHGIPPGMRN